MTNIKNILLSSCLSGLLLCLAACSSDKFKIDGNIVNLEDGAVHVVFSADSGVVDQWV